MGEKRNLYDYQVRERERGREIKFYFEFGVGSGEGGMGNEKRVFETRLILVRGDFFYLFYKKKNYLFSLHFVLD